MTAIRDLLARFRRRPQGERRAAPRYATHLEKSLVVYVHLHGAGEGAEGKRRAARIVGYTRDVSASGLGIIVPDIRLGGVTIINPQRTLRLLVGIPPEPVEMLARPARHVRLDDGELDSGYLVGVQITEMGKEDRARYLKYLKTFEVEEI